MRSKWFWQGNTFAKYSSKSLRHAPVGVSPCGAGGGESETREGEILRGQDLAYREFRKGSCALLRLLPPTVRCPGGEGRTAPVFERWMCRSGSSVRNSS